MKIGQAIENIMSLKVLDAIVFLSPFPNTGIFIKIVHVHVSQ